MNAQPECKNVLSLQRLPQLESLALSQVQDAVCFGTDITCTACTITCTVTLDD